MAPPKKEIVLAVCHKATVLGNKISVHMLEYLSTVKEHPEGFHNLAHEFLDVCHILWAIEAGLDEFSHARKAFPPEMMHELEKKFRATYSDFQSLDQMLTRFLDYERKGTMGKIQKGWRKMFPDNEIGRMRESLGKSREALRMSALVFQWSIGDAKVDDSVGIGYTGLAAALDRMDKGRSVAGIAKVKSLEAMQASIAHRPSDLESVPTIPDFPRVPLVVERGPDSGKDVGMLEEEFREFKLPEIRRHTSISNTIASRDRERLASPGSSVDRITPPTHVPSSHGASTHVPSVHVPSTHVPSIHVPSAQTHSMHTAHTGTTFSGLATNTHRTTMASEAEAFDGPIQVVRIKSDPYTMPRWTPRNTAHKNAANLKASLINAVQSSNHTLIEQLLDHGVSTDTGPDIHALNWAIRHDDVETIRLLLLFGADPNFPSKDGITPLFVAVETASVEAATMLLKYGADPNLVAGPESAVPLAVAVQESRNAMIQLLLTYGADANHMMGSGDTILISSVTKTSSKRLIDILLEYGADPDGKNRTGTSPLFVAIQKGRVDIVTSLLDHGANPNLPGPKHLLWPSTYEPSCLQTLLSRGADPKKAPGIMELAASLNNLESVRILLKAGVDPNAKKDGVYTPLCTSIRDNRPDIFQLLLSSGADPNVMASEYPAWKCVTHNRPQFLPALVQAGADLHKPKGILEMAVSVNNLEALKWLVEQGVSPDDRNAKGQTALTTAIRENRPDMVEFLLSRGANPNVRGEDWPICMAVRQPALLRRLLPHLMDPRAYKGVVEMAVAADQLESVKMLLDAGVSVEDKNGGVFSPLTTSIREDHKEIFRFLLHEAGADPNAPGEHLPIIKAVRRHRGEDLSYLEALLDKGADPNKVYRGWNAIMQAIEHGDSNVLKLLIEKSGADLDAKDESGRTVAEMARCRGWDEGTQMLFAGQEFSG